MVTSKKVQELLQDKLEEPVELAMRYQSPSIESALAKLNDQGVTDLFMIPLFPHYAMSSFETAVERVKELVAQNHNGMRLTTQPPYFEDADYVYALVESIKPHLE